MELITSKNGEKSGKMEAGSHFSLREARIRSQSPSTVRSAGRQSRSDRHWCPECHWWFFAFFEQFGYQISAFWACTPLLQATVTRSSEGVRQKTGTLGTGKSPELYDATGPKPIRGRTFEKSHFYIFFCTNCIPKGSELQKGSV